MYQGKNPTALRSQKCIGEAMLRLMEQKQFTAITVKDICAEADLTRQTFYQFFQTKEEVIRYQVLHYYKDFEKALLRWKPLNLNVLIEVFFRFFKQHREVVLLLIDNHLEYILTEQFSRGLPGIMELCVDNPDEMITNAHIRSFIVGGMTAMLISWLKEDTVTDEVKLAESCLRLFVHNIKKSNSDQKKRDWNFNHIETEPGTVFPETE